jgi:hypothetical protein
MVNPGGVNLWSMNIGWRGFRAGRAEGGPGSSYGPG